MFQDEARFGRVNEPRRCWAAKGFRPEVKKQMVREYTYAYAAVSPKDGVADSLILPLMNTEAMNVFLKEVARRHPQNYILMILDGASSHKSKDLKVPENIRLEKLPPYSPQLNPVENLWEEVREKHFKNKAFESMDAVEELLIEALLYLEENPQTITSITQFPWIISRL